MVGSIVKVLRLSGVFIFSLFLFFSDRLILSWLCLELGTLCLVPAFFCVGGGYSMSALFSYLVVSGVSSGFIVLGLIFPDLMVFLLVGFFIKFGVFPFMGWVYQVIINSNWLVIFLFSIVVKSSFLILCFFLGYSSSTYSLFPFLCCLTLLFLGALFWVYSSSWRHCWCHMMLSSSCVLLMMTIYCSVDTLLWVYLGYSLWGSCCILYFYCYSGSDIVEKSFSYLLFSFLLLTTPISFSLLYKVLMGFNIFSCSFIVFFLWALYSLSEQFYIFKYLCRMFLPKKLGGLSLVV